MDADFKEEEASCPHSRTQTPLSLHDLVFASMEDTSGSILIEVGVHHTYQLACYTPPGISRVATNLAPDTLTRILFENELGCGGNNIPIQNDGRKWRSFFGTMCIRTQTGA